MASKTQYQNDLENNLNLCKQFEFVQTKLGPRPKMIKYLVWANFYEFLDPTEWSLCTGDITGDIHSLVGQDDKFSRISTLVRHFLIGTL